MSARLPTQPKPPVASAGRPLDEMGSPQAGRLATARAFRGLHISDLIVANLKLKKRPRGCSEAQSIASVGLLQTAGGDCPEDRSLLAGAACLERGLGLPWPQTGAGRGLPTRFPDERWELARPRREVPKSFLLPSRQPVQGLQSVLAGSVRRTAKLFRGASPTVAQRHRGPGGDPDRKSHRKGAGALCRGPRRSAHGGGVGRSRSGEFRDGKPRAPHGSAPQWLLGLGRLGRRRTANLCASLTSSRLEQEAQSNRGLLDFVGLQS